MNEIDKAIEEVERVIKSGKYPVVDLSIFDSLDEINITDIVKNEADYTIECYIDYCDRLKRELNEINLKKYLICLKEADIIDNQSLEKEDSFLLSMTRKFTDNTAIDLMIKKCGKKMTKENFIKLHDLLLEGTTSENKIGLRENNLKFVGNYTLDGRRNIEYFPIDYNLIDKALNFLLSYYNNNLKSYNNEYDLIIKPLLYHGLVGALQLFKDGNTRYARLLQHVEIWDNLNLLLPSEVKLPALYATRQYFPYRQEYRDYIKEIAINKNSDAWNNWILFNLTRLQDGILKNMQSVELVKRRIR